MGNTGGVRVQESAREDNNAPSLIGDIGYRVIRTLPSRSSGGISDYASLRPPLLYVKILVSFEPRIFYHRIVADCDRSIARTNKGFL